MGQKMLMNIETLIYGKPVTIETDHQPLVTITRKWIYTLPAWLKHMLKYKINLIYKKGMQLYVADTLSQASRASTHQHTARITSLMWWQLLMLRPPAWKNWGHTVEDATLHPTSHQCLLPLPRRAHRWGGKHHEGSQSSNPSVTTERVHKHDTQRSPPRVAL